MSLLLARCVDRRASLLVALLAVSSLLVGSSVAVPSLGVPSLASFSAASFSAASFSATSFSATSFSPAPFPAASSSGASTLDGLFSEAFPAAEGDSSVSSQDISFARTLDLTIDRDAGAYRIRGSVRERIVLQSDRSSSLSTWSVSDPFYATVSDVEVTVGGDDLDDDRIQHLVEERGDVFISGAKSYRIALPEDLDAGTAIEVTYKVTYASLAYVPVLELPRLPGDATVRAAIRHPAALRVEAEVDNPEQAVQVDTDRAEPERTVITLDSDAGRSVRPLERLPSPRAAVRLTLRDNDGLLTPSTPQAFADWYASKLPSGGLLPDSVAHDLVNGAATRLDTIRALYDFVRKDVRYVSNLEGEGAIIPRSPEKVYSDRYGDCKDKSFFIQRTADQLGIDINLVLLAVNPAPAFEQPHVRSFDHVINAVEVDGDTLFFDGTYRDVPFGRVPYADAGRRVLVLGKTAGWTRTPLPDGADVSIEVDASMDNLDGASAMVTITGPLYDAAARALEEPSEVRRENGLSAIVGTALYRLPLERFLLVEQTDTSVTLQADADLSSFVITSSTRAYLPKAALRVANADATQRSDDSDPLRASVSPGMDLTIRLRAPGYSSQADSLIAGTAEGRVPHFEARLQPSAVDSSAGLPGDAPLRLHYRYRTGPRYIDGSDRSAFLTFTRTLLSAKRKMFVLAKASE